MKLRITLLVTTLTLLFFNLNVLKAEGVKLGKIDKALLEMEVYAPDKSASALIVNDYGRAKYEFSQVEGEIYLIFTRTVRIKILTKEGLEWANWEIMLNKSGNEKEDLYKIKGYTYNLVNGNVEKEKFNGDIHEKNISKYKYVSKFAFTDVKVGSVIDLEYSIKSPYQIYVPDWYFQYSIPVLRSEFKFDYPEIYSFTKRVNGYIDLTTTSSGTYQKDVKLRVEYQRDGYSAGTEYGEQTYNFIFTENIFIVDSVPAFEAGQTHLIIHNFSNIVIIPPRHFSFTL